jgi:hypothetical protein
MALLLNDSVTVGLYPLPETAVRLGGNVSGGAGLIPAGVYEFKPVVPPVSGVVQSVLDKIGQLPETPPIYVSPYDNFTLPVTAIPTFPNEFISGMTITGPIACMLEEPLPVLEGIGKTLRSLAETLRIGISPWWAPGLFFDPFVSIQYPQPPIPPAPIGSPSGQGPGYLSYSANISGYYTDRNWTDREWVLKEPDVVARYNIQGRFTKPAKNLKYPLNPKSIKKFEPSAITPYTFFSTNIITSACAEEVMMPYLRCAEHIIQYKPSEIRMMRFYFLVVIDSVIYPPYTPPPFGAPINSIPLKTPFVAHMTVDAQHDWVSIFKLLCSNILVNGPCNTNRIYEDLNDVPDTPPGDPGLASECFKIDRDFSEYNQELLDLFNNFIQTNTVER